MPAYYTDQKLKLLEEKMRLLEKQNGILATAIKHMGDHFKWLLARRAEDMEKEAEGYRSALRTMHRAGPRRPRKKQKRK